MPKKRGWPKGKPRKPRLIAATLVGPNVLVIVAAILLAALGVSLIVLAPRIVETARGMLEAAAIPTVEIEKAIPTESAFITFGIIYLAIAILMAIANCRIRKTDDRAWMWFLFVLGIICLPFLLSAPSGILTIIGAILYLVKTKKK